MVATLVQASEALVVLAGMQITMVIIKVFDNMLLKLAITMKVMG